MQKSVAILCCAFLMGPAFIWAQELSITQTLPLPHSQIPECYDITFAAEVQQADSIFINRVRFYRNSAILRTVRNAPWEYVWKNAVPGYYEIYATVEDDSGHIAYSDTTWINVGSITVPNLISNGSFSCGRYSPWTTSTHLSAQASFELLDDSWFSDGGLLLVSIYPENPGTETWHVQLNQPMPIDSGHVYVLTFKADVDEDRTIDIVLQENGTDVDGDENLYTVWSQTSVLINEGKEYGPFTFENLFYTDHNNYLRFNIGLTPGDLYLDDILITDASISAAPEANPLGEPIQPEHYIISSNYPNPFNAGTTIHYQLPEKSTVSLSIYTIAGQRIKTFAPGGQDAGSHTIAWNAKDQFERDMPSGIYFYKIDARARQHHFSVSRKIVLIK
jgi:hypothetical protein